MLTPDTKELIEVLLSGKVLICLVLNNGKKVTTIKGKVTMNHFTFERMDDGQINFDFGWGTYGRAGYFTDAQLRAMYNHETDLIANNIVMSCFLMKTFDIEEEFEEATSEFEKFLYGKPSPTNTADNFELTPSD